jgi:hypothetical protein
MFKIIFCFAKEHLKKIDATKNRFKMHLNVAA